MEHQDWNPYYFHVDKKVNGVDKEKEKKISQGDNKETKIEKQIEEGKLAHKKMDQSFGKELHKYRMSQNMTQKEIAQKLNIPVKDINDIENGKMKHNGPLMGKIKRLINKNTNK
tara:strand:+ start:280 stop:621 length:342 start_codon:yes stop_codon:yes gene_type:complete